LPGRTASSTAKMRTISARSDIRSTYQGHIKHWTSTESSEHITMVIGSLAWQTLHFRWNVLSLAAGPIWGCTLDLVVTVWVHL
jgi:hypothetical protein